MSERVVDSPADHGWIEVDGKWVWGASGGSGGGAGMVISESEPTDKVEGMQWLNPTTGLVLFWDEEKWLQMPGGKDGADGQDGADGLWTDEGSNTISYSGTVLMSQPDAGSNSLAIGNNAGKTNQSNDAVAVGPLAGQTTQSSHAVAVGPAAGYTSQGARAVAVGYNSGVTSQGEDTVAVGYLAGYESQSNWSVAIGQNAGMTTQGEKSVAIGRFAGQTSQGGWSVAVGQYAGYNIQGVDAVAVGDSAGYSAQSDWAVAIGQEAGKDSQGEASIAIGRQAGRTSQGPNGIIISSFGSAVDGSSRGHIIIKSPTQDLRSTPSGVFAMNGDPIIGTRSLISTLSTLRNATKDETTLEGLRDSIGNAIGGLIEEFENQIAEMSAEDVDDE